MYKIESYYLCQVIANAIGRTQLETKMEVNMNSQ